MGDRLRSIETEFRRSKVILNALEIHPFMSRYLSGIDLLMHVQTFIWYDKQLYSNSHPMDNPVPKYPSPNKLCFSVLKVVINYINANAKGHFMIT